MSKPTWDEYAATLADLYCREIEFLTDQGHESVEISWRGASNTAIRAATRCGFLLATNAYSSSELAGPGRPREPWFITDYRGCDGDTPVILGQGEHVDFATAYRQATDH